MLSPDVDHDSPSCWDCTGPRAFLKEGLCAIIAGTGSGPEGSRPTAGNSRLQVLGEEKTSGLTGMQALWQPPAGPPFNFDRTATRLDLHRSMSIQGYKIVSLVY